MKLNFLQQLHIVSPSRPQASCQSQQRRSTCPPENTYTEAAEKKQTHQRTRTQAYRCASTSSVEQTMESAYKNLVKLRDLGILSQSSFEQIVQSLTGGSPKHTLQKGAQNTEAPKSKSQTEEPPKAKTQAEKSPQAVQVSEKEVLEVLKSNFSMFAAASGEDESDLITRKDLEAIAAQPNMPERYKKVARFLLQNKVAFNVLDVRGGWGQHDGKIHRNDLHNASIARLLGKKLWT